MVESSLNPSDSGTMSSEEREILHKIWSECQAILANLRDWAKTNAKT